MEGKMTTTITRTEIEMSIKAQEVKSAHEAGLEWIDQRIEQYERAVIEMKRRREQYVIATTKPDRNCTPVNVLEWSANEINNVSMNSNLSDVVRIAARIATSSQ
jgi:hypothetical protein